MIDGRTQIYDSDMQTYDGGLITTTSAPTVSGSAVSIDLGSGHFVGNMVVDLSAVEIASNDELFEISVQGCNTSDFTTGTPAIQGKSTHHSAPTPPLAQFPSSPPSTFPPRPTRSS